MVIKNPVSKTKHLTKKIETNINTICCSGGENLTGHPAVYYNFGNKKQITCQYCGTVYFKSE